MSLLLLFHETGEEAPPSTEEVQQHLLLALMWLPDEEPPDPGPDPGPPPTEMSSGWGRAVGRLEPDFWDEDWKRRRLNDDEELLLDFVRKFVEESE